MLTQEQVKELFEYRNGKLYWKVARGRMKIGTEAGCLMSEGYVAIRFGGVGYRAHRIIYLWHYGFIPKMIDHINGVRADNRIENLRPCDAVTNQHNTVLNRTNTSGVKGVYWVPKKLLWLARISHNKQRVYVGHYKTISEAQQSIEQKRNELHGEFARHK